MTAEQFVTANRAKWERLAQLVSRAGGSGIRRLQSDDLDALGELYRTATSDLALAQRDFHGQPVERYLNQLVAQAHAAVYRGRPSQALNPLRFFSVTFPRTFRALAVFILLAAGITLIPAIANGILIYRNPDAAQWTFSGNEKELIPLVKSGKLWIDLPPEERPSASAFIMTNNIRVSLSAFAGGASAGLLTLYILLSNGLSMGGLLGLCFHYGLGWRLVNFMIGHGVIELSVIFMAAGAGLRMAWAIVHPGLQSRRDALLLASRQALILACGAAPLLVVAGIIEGFVSPLFNPYYSGVAALFSGVLMYGWLLLAGREIQEE
jgi:uncharacterized membrane protein SpoIIM required for sporulation